MSVSSRALIDETSKRGQNEDQRRKGSMKSSIKRVALGVALAAPVAAGVSVMPAGASSLPSVQAITSFRSATAGPNSNLKENSKSVLKFSPKVFNLTEGKGKKCKSTNYEFSITNTTSSTQTVELDGQSWETMSSGQQVDVCSGVGTIKFTVPGSKATLKVNTKA
jgi:hypothetical protein